MPRNVFALRRSFAVCFAASATFLIAGAAFAQSGPPPLDRLHHAQLLTTLDSVEMKPWHLQLAVDLNDTKGLPQEKGTIDEWWAAPNRYRISYAFPSYSAKVVAIDGKMYRTSGQPGPLTIL